MSQPLKFSRTKSPKNRKGGPSYTLELEIPEWMVKSFCTEKWVENMMEKHSKKIKFGVSPKTSEAKDDDKTKGYSSFILTVTGKHRQTIENLARDTLHRYNKMLGVIENLVSK